MELSNEQQIVFNKYIQGDNIFITGPGGSGKSMLIKHIFQHAYQNFKEIHVTALTGCAAVLLNCKAKTIHSWAGIGLGNGSLSMLINKIKMNNFSKHLWKNTNILVVDEVSMLSQKLFELLNDLGKAIRKNPQPFGGIQVIFSGDFYQLPPVGNNDDIESIKFCFESPQWNEVFKLENQIELVKIFRQTDEVYTSILNQIRKGCIKKKTHDLLLQYVGRNLEQKLVAEPTKLFPTRKKVENINNNKMSKLSGDSKTFKIKYHTDCEMTKTDTQLRVNFSEKEVMIELEYISNNLICDTEIHLKIGAQVMSVVNIQNDKDLEICNGSQGIVTGFCEHTSLPKIKFNNGIEMIMMENL